MPHKWNRINSKHLNLHSILGCISIVVMMKDPYEDQRKSHNLFMFHCRFSMELCIINTRLICRHSQNYKYIFLLILSY